MERTVMFSGKVIWKFPKVTFQFLIYGLCESAFKSLVNTVSTT